MNASSYLVTLFFAYTSLLTFCEGLYCTYKPQVTLNIGGSNDGAVRTTIVGEYVDYGRNKISVNKDRFVLVPDAEFGCITNPNTSAIISKAASVKGRFVLAIPLGNKKCSDYKKAKAGEEAGASGILFYYLPDSSSSSRRFSNHDPLSIPVVSIELPEDTLNEILEQQEHNVGVATMMGYCCPSLQTSQTFYFVVFTFCILTVLSCLWFLLSYIRRCRLRAQRRRRRVSV